MIEFDWDAGNTSHIARHDLTPEQVEQVIENDPFDVSRYVRNGEERLNQIGETNEGLVLVVVTTMRQDKVRVVTAHPADRATRAFYTQLRKAQYAEDSGFSE